jgi:hypothetical protein
MHLIDDRGAERDFYFEMQKHAFHLRQQFTARQLAISDLYRLTMDVPGSVIELGVRNGANFFYLARLIEIFHPAQRFDGLSSRHLYGCDTFAGFPAIQAQDQSAGSWHDMREGGVGSNREAFFRDLDTYLKDSPIAKRVHVLEGDVCETIPTLVKERPGLRFSFVYFDLDLYQPTLECLRLLWNKIPKGGIVVLDEYAFPEFPGESQAVDEFFGSSGAELKTIPWCHCPASYVVKK